jgi:hypothetical protein
MKPLVDSEGIRTDIDPFHGRTSRLLGDTLHVMIDLTAVPSMTAAFSIQTTWIRSPGVTGGSGAYIIVREGDVSG